MRPRHVAREVVQELGTHDRVRLTVASGVRQVGELALDGVGVALMQRQAPEQLAAALTGSRQRCEQRVVTGEHAAVDRTERGHHAAGQRRDVDDPLGAQLARVQQAVGQHEAALGVGVVDLDAGPVHRADDVSRAHRLVADHVFSRADHSQQPDRNAKLRDRAEGFEYRCATGHVELHVHHAGAGLDRQPAGVERHGLADERRQRAARAGPVVAQRDQRGLCAAGLRDRRERSHPALEQLRPTGDVHAHAVDRCGQFACANSQRSGIEVVRRPVLKIACAVLGGRKDLGASDSCAHLVVRAENERADFGANVIIRRRCLEQFEAIASKERALDKAAEDIVADVVRYLPAERLRADLARASKHVRRYQPRSLGIERRALTKPDEDHPAVAGAGQRQMLERRPRLASFQQCGKRAACEIVGDALPGEDADRDRVRAAVERCGGCGGNPHHGLHSICASCS